MTALDMLRDGREDCPAKARCLQCHLRWEERHFFPALLEAGAPESQIAAWLDEHNRWRAQMSRGVRPALHELEAHARAEEALCTRYPTLVVEYTELCTDHERIENEAATGVYAED